MSSEFFVPITVHASGVPRQETPVEVDLDLAQLADEPLDANNMRLVEIVGSDPSSEEPAPFQFDVDSEGAGVLTFLLSGVTSPDAERRFRLYVSEPQGADEEPAPLVTVTDGVMHEEQESYRIETPAATYLYHKLGAGFAGMIDPDGADWLSYHPWGGSDGVYRGIPNLAYPESNFHPGNTESTSRIVNTGPLKVTIQSETNDGKWACQWDIFPRFARLTMLRVGHPYWFLYEGTPGGKLDEAGDYLVRAPGIRSPAAERWDERLPAPRWIYFGTAESNRVLYLVHHNDDGETDSYWPMEENMTVFGFGRLGLNSTLEQVPARFTVGFAEKPPDVSDGIIDAVESACSDIRVEVGPPTRS